MTKGLQATKFTKIIQSCTEGHIATSEHPSSVAQARNIPVVLNCMVTSPLADTATNPTSPLGLDSTT
ncbi:hypothetical protein OIU78_017025 [Salix suchowensis]|nr:hypothetical protein OIU78_017025 [Salix suchowensis]